jgi:4-amino-4-deoxy-L-arabinose transferase-like glycosyltransferase
VKRSDRSFALSPLGWAILLFLLALVPRLPGLRLFLTTDEPFFTQEAASVIAAFLRGEFQGTYWHFYPGVTMSWLSGLGLGAQWMLARLAGATIRPLDTYNSDSIVDLIVAVRLPYVLLTAGGAAGFYALVRTLWGHRMALIGALFITFDPFYLAHSRVAHGDAPVTVFMGLSALAFFVYLRTPFPSLGREAVRGEESKERRHRRWLILSAMMGALAALTKAPGQFMALLVVVVGVGDWLLKSWRVGGPNWRLARRWLIDLLLWGGVFAFLFVALWPAMWVDPAGTLVRMLDETFGKVEEGHLVFFMGQPVLKPGLGFYLYVIPFRLTPVTLIGSLASVVLIGLRWRNLVGKRGQEGPLPGSYATAGLLWIFIVSLFLFGNLSPKKQDRYLLPLFPPLDLLAAFAFVQISEVVHLRIGKWTNTKGIIRTTHYAMGNAVLTALFLLHAIPAFTAYPYYLAYFNPLMGGLPRAIDTTLVGWGEGLERAAAYLNQHPSAEQLYVAAVPAQTFLPYFRGRGENFYTNDVALRADYAVLYISQVQRLAPSPEIVRYFMAMEPEHTVYVLGVPYAWIYPGPKFITDDVPPDAELVNVGFGDRLRLAGYQISSPLALPPRASSSPNSNLEIVLYWHSLVSMTADYTISVRMVAQDGTWLAQHDSWPAGGLLPTSQWRQGDFVRDMHSIALPSDAAPGEYELQVVVYDAATDTALNEPLTVASFEVKADSS